MIEALSLLSPGLAVDKARKCERLGLITAWPREYTVHSVGSSQQATHQEREKEDTGSSLRALGEL